MNIMNMVSTVTNFYSAFTIYNVAQQANNLWNSNTVKTALANGNSFLNMSTNDKILKCYETKAYLANTVVDALEDACNTDTAKTAFAYGSIPINYTYEVITENPVTIATSVGGGIGLYYIESALYQAAETSISMTLSLYGDAIKVATGIVAASSIAKTLVCGYGFVKLAQKFESCLHDKMPEYFAEHTGVINKGMVLDATNYVDGIFMQGLDGTSTLLGFKDAKDLKLYGLNSAKDFTLSGINSVEKLMQYGFDMAEGFILKMFDTNDTNTAEEQTVSNETGTPNEDTVEPIGGQNNPDYDEF